MQIPWDEIKVYTAGAARDAAGVNIVPGAVALKNGRVFAAGPMEAVLRETGRGASRVDVGKEWLLLPGLVNAHAHLDLTSIGQQPYGGSFIGWIKGVMGERRKEGFSGVDAVRSGLALSLKSGVFTVGDIVGSREANPLLHESFFRGVAFDEVFGISNEAAREAMRGLERNSPREWGGLHAAHGLQPHAPYSAGPGLYLAAAKEGVPLSTHLAETREELEFVADGRGPFRKMLEEIGKWSDDFLKDYGRGLHPVEWLFAQAGIAKPRAAWLCAHCNYVEDSHIAMLAEQGASVAYCPRASAYFGHTNHRYRDMLAAGGNVCLGTDSILCHGSLSILDEMRFLRQRDGTDPDLLLKMATVNGMRGLCMNEEDATFTPGAAAGLIAIRYDASFGGDPLEWALGAKKTPEIKVLERPGT